jgi:hypothetical protein
MSRLYGPVHRSLQDRFDTRRLADNVEARVVLTELSPGGGHWPACAGDEGDLSSGGSFDRSSLLSLLTCSLMHDGVAPRLRCSRAWLVVFCRSPRSAARLTASMSRALRSAC